MESSCCGPKFSCMRGTRGYTFWVRVRYWIPEMTLSWHIHPVKLTSFLRTSLISSILRKSGAPYFCPRFEPQIDSGGFGAQLCPLAIEAFTHLAWVQDVQTFGPQTVSDSFSSIRSLQLPPDPGSSDVSLWSAWSLQHWCPKLTFSSLFRTFLSEDFRLGLTGEWNRYSKKHPRANLKFTPSSLDFAAQIEMTKPFFRRLDFQ